MENKISSQIKNRIELAPEGNIFATKDFVDIANLATIRKVLSREVNAGKIRRIMDGLYEKPIYSELLQKNMPTDPNEVAKAIAKNYGWTIAPCGDIALNRLGLSTQVPVVWSYVSDGPYRSYEWEHIKITFKHRTNREISQKSEWTLLVTEGLKSLGKEHVDDKTIEILQRRIPTEMMPIVLEETANSSEWIYEIVRKVNHKK